MSNKTSYYVLPGGAAAVFHIGRVLIDAPSREVAEQIIQAIGKKSEDFEFTFLQQIRS